MSEQKQSYPDGVLLACNHCGATTFTRGVDEPCFNCGREALAPV